MALARALLAEPQLLLLDEPLASLDALTRFEMQELIRSALDKENKTMLLVTHDIEEAIFLTDKIFVMQCGTIAKEWSNLSVNQKNRDSVEFVTLRNEIRHQLHSELV